MDELYQNYECIYRSCWENLVSTPLPLAFASRIGTFQDYCQILGCDASKYTFWINSQYWLFGEVQEIRRLVPLVIGYTHDIPPRTLLHIMHSNVSHMEDLECSAYSFFNDSQFVPFQCNSPVHSGLPASHQYIMPTYGRISSKN